MCTFFFVTTTRIQYLSRTRDRHRCSLTITLWEQSRLQYIQCMSSGRAAASSIARLATSAQTIKFRKRGFRFKRPAVNGGSMRRLPGNLAHEVNARHGDQCAKKDCANSV